MNIVILLYFDLFFIQIFFIQVLIKKFFNNNIKLKQDII